MVGFFQVLLVVILYVVHRATCVVEINAVQIGRFPKDFRFGSASAAYQIEGAWDRDGRLPSIWDVLTHNRSDLVYDHTTGDIAANSYELYLEDVKILKDVGVSIVNLTRRSCYHCFLSFAV
jgi:Glycosyl hydrolase family 1